MLYTSIYHVITGVICCLFAGLAGWVSLAGQSEYSCFSGGGADCIASPSSVFGFAAIFASLPEDVHEDSNVVKDHE